MSVKQFNTRIKNKIDGYPTLGAFVPLRGELTIGAPAERNTSITPYVVKIGDGATQFSNLPAIVPIEFSHYDVSTADGGGDSDLVLHCAMDSPCRFFSQYTITDNDDYKFKLKLNMSQDTLFTDHYLLLDNTSGMDKYLDGVEFGQGLEIGPDDIYMQQDYVSSGDIVLIKITLFKKKDGDDFRNALAVTITPGIVNGGRY